MKIAFVCCEYPPGRHGGIGSMVQTLGRALCADGHEVRVVGLYSDLKETTRESDQGVDVWRLPHSTGLLQGIRGRRRLYRRLHEWIEQGEVDLIEVPDYQGWAAFWPSLSVPVVARVHGSATYFASEMGRRTRWEVERFEASSLRRVDSWCSVSAYAARQTRAIFRLSTGPHAVLHNPVAPAATVEWATRRAGMVVYSGTLTEKKGVLALIDAWRGIARRCPEANLHMLGKDGTAPGGGSMIAFLRARLGEEAAATVRFHGHVNRERVLQFLSDARVAAFPSFAEAFAIAPLEAMSVGCPTITTSLGSGPELIEHDVDGLTVDPRHPAEIEAAVLRLLTDDVLARDLAEKGRRKVRAQFSVSGLLEANIGFYRDCVAAHSKRVSQPVSETPNVISTPRHEQP